MKKPAIQFLLALGLGLSALSMSASALDYGVLRQRSTVDSTGAPSLNGIPPVQSTPGTPPPPSNAYGKSWTSYFLGQSKSGVTINYDGTLSDQNYGPYYILGIAQTVWPAPQGATPVDAVLLTYCSGLNTFSYGGYTIAPVFTQDALLSGGPPYDWVLAVKPGGIYVIASQCTNIG